jgi:hypothetical protein
MPKTEARFTALQAAAKSWEGPTGMLELGAPHYVEIRELDRLAQGREINHSVYLTYVIWVAGDGDGYKPNSDDALGLTIAEEVGSEEIATLWAPTVSLEVKENGDTEVSWSSGKGDTEILIGLVTDAEGLAAHLSAAVKSDAEDARLEAEWTAAQ